MNKIVSILLVLGFAFPALAAESVRQRVQADGATKADINMSSVKKRLKGFSLVGFWSLADRLPVKTRQGGVTAKSENAFGFGGEYKVSLQGPKNNLPLSFIGGFVYETARELKSIKDGANTGEIQGANPNFSLFTIYSNLSYRASKQVSVFGGLNYATPSESNFGEVTLKSTLGFQGGMTMAINKDFSADLMYRWINLDGTQGISRIDVDGIVLKGRYIF